MIEFDAKGAIPTCTTAATPGQPTKPLGLNLRDKTTPNEPNSTPGSASLAEAKISAAPLDVTVYWSCAAP